MGEVIWVAIIAGAPALITAIGGLIWVLARLTTIHTIVNGEKLGLMARIVKLEGTISRLKATARRGK